MNKTSTSAAITKLLVPDNLRTCQICHEPYTYMDVNSTSSKNSNNNKNNKKDSKKNNNDGDDDDDATESHETHYPVLSKECQDILCYGCLLNLQASNSEGKPLQKFVTCPFCKTKKAFRPDKVSYNVVLMDWIKQTESFEKQMQQGSGNISSSNISSSDENSASSDENSVSSDENSSSSSDENSNIKSKRNANRNRNSHNNNIIIKFSQSNYDELKNEKKKRSQGWKPWRKISFEIVKDFSTKLNWSGYSQIMQKVNTLLRGGQPKLIETSRMLKNSDDDYDDDDDDDEEDDDEEDDDEEDEKKKKRRKQHYAKVARVAKGARATKEARRKRRSKKAEGTSCTSSKRRRGL
jgi:hypothetical protein